MKLNIYADDTLKKIKRVAETDKLRIPYRVALTAAKSLDEIDLDHLKDKQVLELLTSNVDNVDKILKATFGVTDAELECVDVAELGAVAMEIYAWAIEKINSLGGSKGKN